MGRHGTMGDCRSCKHRERGSQDPHCRSCFKVDGSGWEDRWNNNEKNERHYPIAKRKYFARGRAPAALKGAAC